MAPRRTLLVLLTALAFLVVGGQARATGDVVDVVEVDGLVDERLVDFALDVLETTDADLVVLQVDSAGAVTGDVAQLIDAVARSTVPVVVWVGPAPAVAQGGSLQLLLSASIRAAAPDVRLGYAAPTVAGGADSEAVVERFPDLPADLLSAVREVSGPIDGVVDVVAPSIGQLIVGLDGEEVVAADETKVLATAQTTLEDGREVIRPTGEVRFYKPGLTDRVLRIAMRPEAAYLFLMIGLALIVFEFYAVGPGLAAAVGVAALLLAGYGLATLPINWWALLLALAGIAIYVFEFQRNALGIPSGVATGLLLAGGLLMSRGEPQIRVVWWAVVLVVVSTAFFFGVALTTVARARFSTPTIGREGMIGAGGVAETALDPEGVVVIDEARWRARARRAAEVEPGRAVRVVGIDGVLLEVEPTDG